MILPDNPVAILTEYELRHLAAHLEAAGRDKDLHHLLALETSAGHNAWFEAKLAHSDLQGYLTDIQLAWRLTEIAHDIPRQIQYALCQSSVVTLLTYFPPKLLIMAIKYQILPPQHMLPMIKLMRDMRDRAEALQAHLTYHRPDEQLLAYSLTVARSLDLNDRAELFATLALCLPEALGSEVMQETVETVRLFVAHFFPLRLSSQKILGQIKQAVKGLINLTPYLSESLQTETLTWVHSIKDEEILLEAIIDLAPHLPEAFLVKVLATSRKIRRAALLLTLLPYLPEDVQQETLQNPMAIARKMIDVSSKRRAEILIRVVPYLSDHLQREVLESVLFILIFELQNTYEEWPLKTFARLVPYLSQDQLSLALFSVPYMRNIKLQRKVLIDLAPHVEGDLVLEILQEIRHPGWRAKLLTDLVPCLSGVMREEILQEALAAAQRLNLSEIGRWWPDILESQDKIHELKWLRAYTLAGLAHFVSPSLQEEFLEEILASIRKNNESCDSRVLNELVKNLLELTPGFTVIDDIFLKPWQQRVLNLLLVADLWANLPEALQKLARSEVLAVAQKTLDEIHKVESQIEILLHFVLCLPEALQEIFLQAALGVLPQSQTFEVLNNPAPYLSEKQLLEAIVTKLLQSPIENQQYLFEALNRVAPVLSQKQLKPIMRVLLQSYTIRDQQHQDWVLNSLVHYSPEKQLTEILAKLRKIPDESLRARVFVCLPPYLPKALLADALAIVRTIHDELLRAEAIISLTPSLSKAFLADALTIVQTIKSDSLQISFQILLAFCLLEARQMASAVALALMEEIRQGGISVQSIFSFEDLFIQTLTTVPAGSYAPATLLVKALLAWRPLEVETLERILAMTPIVISKLDKFNSPSEMTSDSAKALPGPTLSEELVAVPAIENPIGPVKTLTAQSLPTITALQREIWREAITSVRAIRNAQDRAEALSLLSPCLRGVVGEITWEEGYAEWQVLLHQFGALPRAGFLYGLHKLIPFTLALVNNKVENARAISQAIQKVKSARAIPQAIQAVGKWWP